MKFVSFLTAGLLLLTAPVYTQVLVQDAGSNESIYKNLDLPNPNALPLPPAPSLPPNAGLRFETTQVNLGRISDGDIAVVEYHVENTTDSPIRIISIDTGCGCTAVTGNPEVIEPGAKEVLKLEFHSDGRLGENRRYVSIETDDPNAKSYKAMFVVNVVREIIAEPSNITFGTFRVGTPQTATFAIVNTSGKPASVKDIRSDNPYITTEVAEENVKATVDGQEALKTIVAVKVADNVPQGNIASRLMVTMDTENARPFIVNLRGTVAGDIIVSPDRLLFQVAAGSESERTFRISSRARGDIRVLEAKPFNNSEYLDVEIRDGANASEKHIIARLTNPQATFTTKLMITVEEVSADRRTTVEVPVHVMVRGAINPAALQGGTPAPNRPTASQPIAAQPKLLSPVVEMKRGE